MSAPNVNEWAMRIAITIAVVLSVSVCAVVIVASYRFIRWMLS